VSTEIQIRWAEADEAPDILQFIQAMGFNPRDKITWDELEMVAMSAWQGGKLIGAIPLEPRPLKIAGDKSVWTMHETVVAVHPDHRGAGIGSKMQEEIFSTLPAEIELLSVFREEPESPAYRWYIKNNFKPAMRINSWFYEASPEFKMPEVDLFVPTDARLPWDELAEIWQNARQNSSGIVDQTQRDLKTWLSIHPYRKKYDFMIAVERSRLGFPAGYALLGTGTMHSESKRCDILDLVSRGGPKDVSRLVEQFIPFMFKSGCTSIRWPLTQNDPNTQIAQALGFIKKWSFDMLVRPLPHSSVLAQPAAFASFASIDYI
jgi:GNAT superfamily N-acetyltransferase